MTRSAAERSLRNCLSAALSGTLLLGSLPANAVVKQPLPVRLDAPRAKATLLLDRFTFGIRPGDIDTVTREGVDAWFDNQLDPSRVDDSALEQRLDVYPALRMTQTARLARYPEPNSIRQMARTGALPSDPEARAIVRDQVEFYQMAQQNKAANGVAAKAAAPVVRMTPDGMQQPVTVAPPVSATADAAKANAAAAADLKNQNLEQLTEAMPQPQADAIVALPPDERYQRLLSMTPVQLIALRKAERGPNEGKLAEGMTPLQRETLLALAGTNRMLMAEVIGSRLLRDIYSDRQIEAVMTDFWLNHFNIYSGKNGQEPSMLPDFEKTVRQHALGHFEDLLIATAMSPAMLMYLDNATSVGPDSLAASRAKKSNAKKSDLGLNENYARELMELHTLGVTGGYTQKDVTEVAKVFTGWTLDRPNDGGNYNFTVNRHQPGPKTVLGKTISENGEKEGLEVLHMLASSPATAHFISTELAQRFVADTPPPALVDRMVKSYLSSNGDIKAVLRTMIHSPEFFTTATVHAKLKTPLEYVTSAVRVSGADVTNPAPLAQALNQLGMPLYGCQPPTGYKWDEETWLSSSALVNRMNFALSLSTNRVPGTTIDWTRDLQTTSSGQLKAVALNTSVEPPAMAPEQKELKLESRLLDGPASEQTRSAVISQGNDNTAQAAAQQFQSGTARPLTDAEKMAMKQDQIDMAMAGRAPAGKGQGGNQRALGALPLKPGPAPLDKQAAAMAGLLLGSPEFQRR